jgi:hypothetical protein
MKIREIKEAVESGKTVHWVNPGYTVIKDSIGQFLIHSCFSGVDCYTGLHGRDEYANKLNGDDESFYIADNPEEEDE